MVGSWLLAVTVASTFGLVGSALAACSSSTQTSSVATVSEAVELSGLIASPTYPNWYWTHSDVWKTTDTFSACSGLSGAALAECQQAQRARLWALRIDPVTHKVTASREFALSNPAWALDPVIAQNNDWEDIALGPPRADGDGTSTTNLILAATGDARQNRVRDAAGRDITCDTRRLIEFSEPNLADPTAATWTPWQIYDIKSWVGVNGITSCNVESLVVSTDAAGQPTAYLVTRTARKVLGRSLDTSTGRPPETPRAAEGYGLPYQPAVTYVGTVRDAKGFQITAGDTSGGFVSLLVRKTAATPCQILTWTLGSSGLGATLTGTSPAKSLVTCNPNAEGLAYVRDPDGNAKDLIGVADTNAGGKFQYWYFPDS